MTFRCVIAVFLSCWIFSAEAAEVRLEFREPVFKGGEMVVVSELLNVWSAEAEILDRVTTTSLTIPSERGRITRAQVLNQLKDVHHEVEWIWIGPSTIRRTQPWRYIDGHTIAKTAVSALQKHLEAQGIRAVITHDGRQSSVAVAESDVNVRARIADNTPLRRRMAVMVELDAGNGAIESVPVWLAIEAYKEVPVYLRDMRRGEGVSAADLQLQEIDLTRVQGELLTSTSFIDAQQLRHDVNAGTALVKQQLEAAPTVKRGDRVSLQLVGETISIIASGIARGQGFPGDMIEVLVDGAAKPTRARITGQGETRIDY